MELVGLFLLVLMPPADATGETAEALTVSIHAELGDVTMVLAPDTLVTPAMWQGENASMRARFVAHVIWKDKNNITVDVVSNGDAGSRAQFHESRSLAFAAEDSKTERGRAMALVLAELLRESPAAALIVAHPPGAVEASASRLALAGLFAERCPTPSPAPSRVDLTGSGPAKISLAPPSAPLPDLSKDIESHLHTAHEPG